MKTKTKILISTVLTATTLLADASMDFGVSSATLDNGSANGGFSLDSKGFFHPKGFKNLGLGGELGIGYFTVDKIRTINDDAGIVCNLDLLLGYTYNQATIYGGGGYSVGQVGSASFDGSNYMLGTEYSFNKRYGLGIKYKHHDIDFVGFNTDNELEIGTLYLKYTPSGR